MKNRAPSSARPSRFRLYQRILVAVLGILAIFISGSILLFTGSEVKCEELMGEAGGPSISCTFEVAASPQAVWGAFTLTDQPLPQYFDAILEADMRRGGRWRFLTDDRERFLAGGEILVIEPPRRFEHTFFAADLDDSPSRITVDIETVDIEGASIGSRVILVHDRFVGRTTTYRRFRRAHPLVLSALKSLLETGELPFRARLYTTLFKPGMKVFTVRAEPWTEAS